MIHQKSFIVLIIIHHLPYNVSMIDLNHVFLNKFALVIVLVQELTQIIANYANNL